MAQVQHPRKGILAAAALWTNFNALYDALAKPSTATELAIKLSKGAVIALETRDVIQSLGTSANEQASLLLQAVVARLFLYPF